MQISTAERGIDFSHYQRKTPSFLPGKETRPFTPEDWILPPSETNAANRDLPKSKTLFEARKQIEKQEQQEAFFSKEWLQKEVANVRSHPAPEGQTPWYHLAGTGFWVKEQVSQLMRNVQGAGKEAFPDVLEKELGKVSVDIKAFEEEYLMQMASLKWNVAWSERDGKKQLICPDYKGSGIDSEGTLLSEVTGKDERDGAVYETLFGDEAKGTTGVQGWLAQAPDNSYAVMVSPAGWSGLKDADGQKITFPGAQNYVIRKVDEHTLQAYTFRTDSNIMQNEAFQEKLGLSIIPADNQKDRLKNTLFNVAFLTPEDALVAEQNGKQGVNSFEDIIDILQDSLDGRETAYNEGGNIKTFADIKAFIKQPEAYDQQHPLTQKLIQRFQDYARWRIAQGGGDEALKTDLQIALAITPLHLHKLYREKNRLAKLGISSFGTMEYYSDKLVNDVVGGTDYRAEAGSMEELPGCSGGGKKRVRSWGSYRDGMIGTEEDYDFDHFGTCVVCNDGGAKLGPCDICVSCDADLGGKAAVTT